MIYIAIKMLYGDKPKFVGLVFGVFFASFLMTFLLSMFSGMMTRTFAFVQDTGWPEIWVMDPAVEYIEEIATLPQTALDRVRGVPGVMWAVPVYSGTLRARLPGGRFRSVQVIGLDDATLAGGPPTLSREQLSELRRTDGVIVDEWSTRNLLRMPVEEPTGHKPVLTGPTRPLKVGDTLSINDHRAVVVGITPVAPRFIIKPTVYTTYNRALAYAPPERNLLSFVLVKTAPGADLEETARRIEETTGLRARTQFQFQSDTVWYYVKNTPIIGQVGMMVSLGTIVGFAITGQLLYMFTHDNLRQYAALKAMGLPDRTLLVMVMVQALAVGLIGLGLGIGGSSLLGYITHGGLPFRLLWVTPLAVGSMMLLICVFSAAISAVKVVRLEPGIVFR